MNTIIAELNKSDYEIHDGDLNFKIDGYWLDEYKIGNNQLIGVLIPK